MNALAQDVAPSALEARLRAVEDELAIRTLAARFSDCANERDFAGFASLWSEKAVWEIGPPLPARAEGIAAIVAMLEGLLQPQLMFMQMTHSGVVSIDGDRATARFVERERGKGRTRYYENLAVYDDLVERGSDGVWRFARRSYRYRFLDDSAFTGRVFPLDKGPDDTRPDEPAVAGTGS